jgi:hypothetical protein
MFFPTAFVLAVLPILTRAAAAAASSNADAQTSLTLNPAVIATGFEQNGQETVEAGQVPSLTSSNNFINFCETVPNLPITNGKQITTGSCNPAPMGIIAATTNMPSCKFVFPPNGDSSLAANTPFTVQLHIQNLDAGNFVNAEQNYFAAPQQTTNADGTGNIKGHSHIVIEQLSSFAQTTPTDPTKFAFFKGLNAAADANGNLFANVTAGLPAGAYKVSSINTGANHAPVLVPVAQHGSLDDAVYFTVGGASSGVNVNGASAGAAAGAAAAPARRSLPGRARFFRARPAREY